MIIVVAVLTTGYTAYGGVLVSIVTDQVLPPFRTRHLIDYNPLDVTSASFYYRPSINPSVVLDATGAVDPRVPFPAPKLTDLYHEPSMST